MQHATFADLYCERTSPIESIVYLFVYEVLQLVVLFGVVTLGVSILTGKHFRNRLESLLSAHPFQISNISIGVLPD